MEKKLNNVPFQLWQTNLFSSMGQTCPLLSYFYHCITFISYLLNSLFMGNQGQADESESLCLRSFLCLDECFLTFFDFFSKIGVFVPFFLRYELLSLLSERRCLFFLLFLCLSADRLLLRSLSSLSACWYVYFFVVCSFWHNDLVFHNCSKFSI